MSVVLAKVRDGQGMNDKHKGREYRRKAGRVESGREALGQKPLAN